MNILDVILLILIGLIGFSGYNRGLLRMVFGFVSLIAALIITGILYMPFVNFLRTTPLYTSLMRGVANTLGLDLFSEYADAAGRSLIDVLPLHSLIIETLHLNNNSVMHGILGVSNIQEFIAGFIANMILIAIAVLVIFIIAMVLLSFAGGVVDVVGRLPVIYTFNNIGGLLVGLLFGMILTGLGIFVVNLLFGASTNLIVRNLLYGSAVVRFMQNSVMPQIFGSFI